MERSRFMAILFAVLTAVAAASLQFNLPWISAATKSLPASFEFITKHQQPVVSSAEDWNILYHLGGDGPWVRKTDNVVDGGIAVPEGCRVDQVHMMSRHAERYPSFKAGIRMLELYHRLKHIPLSGSLSFVNNWTFFLSDPNSEFENLVSTGPYAGTLQAFATGVKMRTRYSQLLALALDRNQTSLWASGSPRVVETAEYFRTGLFGLQAANLSTLHVIPETAERGGDTLTPGDTCLNYVSNTDPYGHDYGYAQTGAFRSTYLPAVVARLEAENPGVRFSVPEVWVMQEMCGFETLAKGSSPWCGVFTHDEWGSFAYARDVLHYYRSGPGNKYGGVLGHLWLNATTSLLRQGSAAGPLFFSFVHDGDIIPLLAALDLFPQPSPLPTTHIPANHTFDTSTLVPMSGHLLVERLLCRPVSPSTTTTTTTSTPFFSGPGRVPIRRCRPANDLYPNHVYCEDGFEDGDVDDADADADDAVEDDEMREKVYVRVIVNDAAVAVPGCDAGPGRSCPWALWRDRVRRRGEEVGDFGEVCGLEGDAARGVGFLHQRY